MKGQMNINYDELADYLEIFIGKPVESYGEETQESGVTLFKDSKTNEVIGFGVLDFKNKTKNVSEIKLNLPIDIGIFEKVV